MTRFKTITPYSVRSRPALTDWDQPLPTPVARPAAPKFQVGEDLASPVWKVERLDRAAGSGSLKSVPQSVPCESVPDEKDPSSGTDRWGLGAFWRLAA